MQGQGLENVLEYLRQGGFVMPPLVGGAMVLWYAIGYRWVTLRWGKGGRSLRRLVDRHTRGQPGKPHGIIDTAVATGLRVMGGRPADPRAALDDALYDLELELGRYEILVQAIVMTAPLAGLLGTVSGMIETFNSLADMSLFSRSGGIAGGISQALITTQMGLAVAIPGLLMGRFLRRRQERLADELSRLKDILCSEVLQEAA
jgi:biopolymer transport protein ExbB